MSSNRQVGTVAKWLNHRGIGFITPDGAETVIGKDLLVHHSNIKQGGNAAEGGDTFKTLAVGSRVEFDTAPDPKNTDKMIAINVTGVGGGDCERRTRYNRNKETFTVLVDNVAESTTWRDLKDLFRKCGYVDRADIDKNRQGIIRYTTEEGANSAVERYDGYELQGKKLQVKRE